MADRMMICATCAAGPAGDGTDVAALAGRLSAMVGPGCAVEITDCMNVCGKPVTVAFRADGKAAYLFAGVDLERQTENLAAFARLYAETGDGIIEDARPCGDLRFCLIGRIPA